MSQSYSNIIVNPTATLKGVITPPGDKSISHRSILINSVANGSAHIKGFVPSDDCMSSVNLVRALGCSVDVKKLNDRVDVIVKGVGMFGYDEPNNVLDAGNSGTTARLMSGLLASRNITTIITGDKSLRSRPMGRIVRPLREMGSLVLGRNEGLNLPLVFAGGSLKGISYEMPVSSAQLKSALLLAALRANNKSTIIQPNISRNHTETLLKSMGASVDVTGNSISVTPGELHSVDITIPGDISSAAFWLVAASCHKNAELLVKNVGINESRAGVITVLKSMNANLLVENKRVIAGEQVADITIKSSTLKGTLIEGDIIPLLIDEIPIICVAAAMAEGTTIVKDASELRVKETDRIKMTTEWLTKAGVNCEGTDDGMIIEGSGKINGGFYNSGSDHRIAMSLAVAGLIANSPITVSHHESANISYPGFWETINKITNSKLN